jgi:hypothetical protein
MTPARPETPATRLLREYSAALRSGDAAERFRLAGELRRYGIKVAARMPTARAMAAPQPHPAFARPPAGTDRRAGA